MIMAAIYNLIFKVKQLIEYINRRDMENVGDIYSSPLKYFKYNSNYKIIDIYNITKLYNSNNIIILGGGGLFGTFDEIYNIDCKNIIVWGAGYNIHYNSTASVAQVDTFLNKCMLVGLRDYNTKYEYVPCSSCMLNGLKQKYDIRNRIVIFEHKDVPINIDGIPKIKNNYTNISHVLEFLGSAEFIITNSYHGVYWATLLNKRVLVIPFSSRFDNFKHKPTICTVENYKTRMEEAISYNHSLEECRYINMNFAKKIKNLV